MRRVKPKRGVHVQLRRTLHLAPRVGPRRSLSLGLQPPRLLGLSLASGKPLWSEPRQLAAVEPDSTLYAEPPAPIWSEKHNLVFVGFFAGGHGDARVQAHNASSGEPVWASNVSGHNCTCLRWEVAGALSSEGDHLLLWSAFALQSVSAVTGRTAWSTMNQLPGLAVVGGHIPGIGFGTSPAGETAVLILVNEHRRDCDAMYKEGGVFIQALREKDGVPLGRTQSPMVNDAAVATPPVEVGGLWIHGDQTEPPKSRSTIYAVRANYSSGRAVTNQVEGEIHL